MLEFVWHSPLEDFSVECSADSSSADDLKGHYDRSDGVTDHMVSNRLPTMETSCYWRVLYVCDALNKLKDKYVLM